MACMEGDTLVSEISYMDMGMEMDRDVDMDFAAVHL